MPILTIGHSVRPLDSFVRILRAAGVALLLDVRTVPRSRHNPQFNRETLPDALREAGIGYRHVPELGGLRKPVKGSVNTAWRNTGFRGFADHMQTPAFEKALAELLEMERAGRVAIMCAEAVPWRCHRSLIADALTARGAEVRHVVPAGPGGERPDERPHEMTSWASVTDGRVTYPGLVS